eukprot:11121119-Heterocapsa_arctica.AAC.1
MSATKRGRPLGTGKKAKKKEAGLIEDQDEEDIEMEEDRRHEGVKRALEEGGEKEGATKLRRSERVRLGLERLRAEAKRRRDEQHQREIDEEEYE